MVVPVSPDDPDASSDAEDAGDAEDAADAEDVGDVGDAGDAMDAATDSDVSAPWDGDVLDAGDARDTGDLPDAEASSVTDGASDADDGDGPPHDVTPEVEPPTMRVCLSCGGDGQPCCARRCADHLACERDDAGVAVCGPCGLRDEPCCPGARCEFGARCAPLDDGFDRCIAIDRDEDGGGADGGDGGDGR